MLSFHKVQHSCFYNRNPLIILCILVIVSIVSGIPAPSTGETCVNPRRKTGTCIVITACPELYSILINRPLSEVNRLYLTESQCGEEGRYPKVCCANKEEEIRVPLLSSKETGEKDFDFSKKNENIPGQRDCGEYYVDKIVGGNTTALDQYPWMALLGYQKENQGGFNYDFLCGGSLVSNRYILTAAHCITNIEAELKIIRLGEWDLSLKEDCIKETCSEPPKDIKVESVKVHENYDNNSIHQRNDIALIRMAENVYSTLYISPICLPLISEKVSKTTHFGEYMIVAGWGKTEDGPRSHVKQQVHVPVVEQEDCKDFWKKSHFNVADTQFCAGGREGKDSCKGDSGGAIFITEKEGKLENYYVRGIISAGVLECGTEDAFSLYTDVTKYNHWLWKNIKA